ncbi:MAG: hypothetical protein R3350_02505, partial [Saprospiraceae bacterium]|nr:hypothetical protein [Saprospiraceae bacterium]
MNYAKSSLVFSALFLCTSVFSQISLSSENTPDIGDVFIFANADTTGVSIGPAGADQTWDFSSLASLSSDTVTYINPTLAPEISNFPMANLASEQEGAFTYFEKNLSTFSVLGGAFDPDNTGQARTVKFDPKQVLLRFPTTFQSSFVDTSALRIEERDQDGTLVFKRVIVA